MKRLRQGFLYGMLPILGLLYVIGCGGSSTGGQTYFPYTLTVSVEPDTMSNGDNPAIVSCFLYYEGALEGGETLLFSVASDTQAIITGQATSVASDTATGTTPVVYYDPNSVAADWDTIYAVYENALGEVAAEDFVVVRILP
ncbi:MAG TPA: hypothetical protein VF398_09060 [bacterium]